MTDILKINPESIDYSKDQISPAQVRFEQRQSIKSVAGDSDSLSGSIADASQMTMLVLGQLLLKIKEGKPIEDIIDSDPAVSACVAFAQAEASGEMKVPFKQKPTGEALADIIKRTDAVAQLYGQ